MRLNVRQIKLKAGKPIAFLHERDALKLGVNPGDRVRVSCNGLAVIAVIDISSDLFSKGNVALSQEIIDELKIKSRSSVEVTATAFAKGSQILQKRVQCSSYTKHNLKDIMEDITNGNLSEAEIAYFVSGIYHCGLSLQETLYLTEAIFETGKKLRWHTKKIADKHSIGGIPGNRTTPIVVSICAAAGIIMPKTSSRAITSCAGTADVIESIARVDFSPPELKKIVKKTGACLAWGGSIGLSPADDKLIQVEKKLNLDPEPQLIASILSKKLAVGSKYVLIDIPFGKGAKVSRKEAVNLKRKFIYLGKRLGFIIQVVLTDGKQPIGNGIGPILEIRDVLRVLRRDNSPKDLELKSVMLSGFLLEMLGKAKKGKGRYTAMEILNSGKAFAKFKEIIKAQSGSINNLKSSRFHHTIFSSIKSSIRSIDNRKINLLARILGCPRDKASGLYIHKHVGESIVRGDSLITFYAESRIRLKEGLKFFHTEKPISL